jgi:hypothetical protein
MTSTPIEPKKQLFALAGPIYAIRHEFHKRGFHAFAEGVTLLNADEIADVSQYPTGEHVKWFAWGTVQMDMLDNMTEHFGPRTQIDTALEWFGARI